jgi:hypothetical protein
VWCWAVPTVKALARLLASRVPASQIPTPAPLFVRITLSAVSGDPDIYACKDASQCVLAASFACHALRWCVLLTLAGSLRACRRPSFINFDFASRNSSAEDAITIVRVVVLPFVALLC